MTPPSNRPTDDEASPNAPMHYYPGAGKYGEFREPEHEDVPSSLELDPDMGYDPPTPKHSHPMGMSSLQFLALTSLVLVALAVGGIFLYRAFFAPDPDEPTAKDDDVLTQEKKQQSEPTPDPAVPTPLGLTDDYALGVNVKSFSFDDAGYIQPNMAGTRLAVVTDTTLQQVSFPQGKVEWTKSLSKPCVPYYLGDNVVCGRNIYDGEDGAHSDLVPPQFSGHELSSQVAYTQTLTLVETLTKDSDGNISAVDIWAVNHDADVIWHHACGQKTVVMNVAKSRIFITPTEGAEGAAVLSAATGIPITRSIPLPDNEESEILVEPDGYLVTDNDKVIAHDFTHEVLWEEPLDSSLLFRVQLDMSSTRAAYSPAPLKAVRTFLSNPDQEEAWWLDAAGNAPVYMTDGELKTTHDDDVLVDFSDVYDTLVTERGTVTIIQSSDQFDVTFVNNDTGKTIGTYELPEGSASRLDVVGAALVGRSPHNLSIYIPQKV